MIVSMIQELGITSLMTVPTIMEDITSSEDFSNAARVLASLDFIAVGGGGLKQSTGYKLHKMGVKILNHFGATELGALSPIFRPDKDYDYNYLRVRSDLGLKLCSLNSKLHGERACKLIGYPFGWDCAFELQDRLEYNPLKPHSEVKILGRNDDIIVLATGEKVQPSIFERALEQESSIRRAIMFGHGQNETGVLIEPSSNIFGDEDLFLREVWPSIQQANRLIDGQGRISSKSAILIKPDDKELPLSEKGVPQRKRVYSVFNTEIEALYRQLETGKSKDSAMDINLDDIKGSFRRMVQRCLPSHRAEATWGDDDDFIHLGMDSLQVMQLRRILNASLSHSGHYHYQNHSLPADFIYSHPSVSHMVAALEKKQQPQTSSKIMEDLLRKYGMKSTDLGTRPQGSIVLLTGSTGNLGSHLLLSLMRSPDVKKIICLIRAKHGETGLSSVGAMELRQTESFEERGIAPSEHEWSKIKFLPWKPGTDHLGLDENTYRYLASVVTDIFHSAWPMDFKRKLTTFAPHIQTVRELLQLGRDIHNRQTGLRPRVVFASSIATVGRYQTRSSTRVVPELPLADPETALPMGYSEAKWVCENVMESAYDLLRSEINPMIVRIGQLSGSQKTGYWSSKEHIAALVKASETLGRMPVLEGVCPTFRDHRFSIANGLVAILDSCGCCSANRLGISPETFP
jgi:nucleoside-diphosphate-sugar epimerase